jgi:hypothetical protein
MIRNDEQLAQAQLGITNLQSVLLKARQVHSADEYRAMSEPILLEIQQREQEVLAYLSKSQIELPVE